MNTIVSAVGCKVAEGKPRLRRNSQGLWRCFDSTHFQTFASTPTEAYFNWWLRKSKLTCIPRRGYWNIKDTHKWVREGCRPTCFWIGNKQVVGYVWATDEIVLRG